MQHMTLNFFGDGRCLIHPNTSLGIDHIGLCKPVKLHQARRMVNGFLRTGSTHHSPAGTFIWVLQEFCNLHQLPCHIELSAFGGSVKLLEFS